MANYEQQFMERIFKLERRDADLGNEDSELIRKARRAEVRRAFFYNYQGLSTCTGINLPGNMGIKEPIDWKKCAENQRRIWRRLDSWEDSLDIKEQKYSQIAKRFIQRVREIRELTNRVNTHQFDEELTQSIKELRIAHRNAFKCKDVERSVSEFKELREKLEEIADKLREWL